MPTRELSPQLLFGSLHSFYTHSLSLSYTHTWDNSCLALDKHRKRELTPWLLASRTFLSLSQFWRSRRRLCRNRVRSLLSMCFLLFGYSLEPRPYSRVLGTVGSVMTIGLSYKGCSHLENQFDERKQDWPVHKFGLRRLKRLDAIQTVSFSAAHSRRQKEAQHARSPPGEIFRKRRGYCACLRLSSNVDLFMLGRPK